MTPQPDHPQRADKLIAFMQAHLHNLAIKPPPR